VKSAPPVAPLHPWLWPPKPWQRLHIDFAGPFHGRTFLIVVDAHSKRPEVVEMKTTTTTANIQELWNLFSTFGLPEQVVSDNGPQFISSEFAQFLKSNGVKHIKSAPYHPSMNGMAERFVQSFKKAMMSSDSQPYPFEERLATFLLLYRTTIHPTTNATPCMLLMKHSLRTRLDLLRPNVEGRVAEQQAKQKESHNACSRDRQFFVGQRVMARNLRPGPKWIPGTVIECNGPPFHIWSK